MNLKIALIVFLVPCTLSDIKIEPHILDFINTSVKNAPSEDSLIIVDLDKVYNQAKIWNRLLPRVKFHFAVKTNPQPVILELLAAAGGGFDCASEVRLTIDNIKNCISNNTCFIE